jgi:hypothetical protein
LGGNNTAAETNLERGEEPIMLDRKLIELLAKQFVTDDELEFICCHEQVKRVEYTAYNIEANVEKYWIETIDDKECFVNKEGYIYVL